MLPRLCCPPPTPVMGLSYGEQSLCRVPPSPVHPHEGAPIISGRFRQFYFLPKTRITPMKNALKSRSLFAFYKGHLFLTSTRRYENLRKVPPFLIKSRTFLGLVFDIKWTNFLEKYSYLTNHKKARKENFSSFFRFLPFYTKSKKVDFFYFSLFRLFGGQLSKKAGNQSSDLSSCQKRR